MADPTKAAVHTTAFKIEDLSDATDFLRILIYGRPGCGKTTLAASCVDVPEMGDVLLLDLEDGKEAIRGNDRIKARSRIKRVRITSYKELAEVHKFLKAHCRFRDTGNIENLKKLESQFSGVPVEDIDKPQMFNSVIIDSLTELNTFVLYELLGLSTNMNLIEAMDDGEVDTAGFTEYKKNNQLVQLITRAYRDLPINTFFICHESFIQDEMKKMHYAPALTGKLAGQVQGFVDIVGYLRVGKLKEGESAAPRRLYIQPVGNFDAKNRQASIKESFFDNPVMLDIYNALSGKTEKESKPTKTSK